MSCIVKLKVGFFKTHYYYLTVESRQIILTPQDGSENPQLVINENELQSIRIYKKDFPDNEFEIVTNKDIYMGRFILATDVDEVYQLMAKEFGEKTALQ
jgi:hypothetical protein